MTRAPADRARNTRTATVAVYNPPLDQEMIDWIEAHRGEDPDRLRLRHHGDERISFAITQIECRQRAAAKLPTLVACPRFVFPSTLAAEQSTSETLARYHASLISPGDRVVDLTCGLGVDAFTIASRAARVTAVEIDPAKAQWAEANATVLGIENIRIVCADAGDYLEEMKDGEADVIFIDPARRSKTGSRLFALSDCSPDVVALMPRLLEKALKVIVKASPMLDVTSVARDLAPHVRSITALGTTTECKELVVTLTRDSHTAPEIDAVTIGVESSIEATSEYTGEKATWLYEPWPATMKVITFLDLQQEYGVEKMAPDTHLYLGGGMCVSDFPGRKWRIVEMLPFDKRTIARVGKNYPVINVATRGMGMSADDLRRRLRVKDGGVLKLFGVKDRDGRRKMIIASPW